MRQGERAARQGSPARADLYRRLRDAILGADYKPGEPLSENALAQRFGVSRTPVRDALARLSDEGLVEVFPQRGSAVSRISADRVRQLLFMRRVLETAVVGTAAARCDGALEKALRELLRRQQAFFEKNDTLAFLRCELAYNARIYRFCGRAAVWNAYRFLLPDAIRVQYLRMQTFYYRQSPALRMGLEYHLVGQRMLFDALAAHDQDAARRLVRESLGEFERDLQRLRDLFPSYFAQEDLRPQTVTDFRA